MSKTLSKNVITHLDDVFLQSQTKREMFKVLDKNHRILLKQNMRAAPDKSQFFLTQVKFFGHIIESTTVTPFKSRIDAIRNYNHHPRPRITTLRYVQPIQIWNRRSTLRITN